MFLYCSPLSQDIFLGSKLKSLLGFSIDVFSFINTSASSIPYMLGKSKATTKLTVPTDSLTVKLFSMLFSLLPNNIFNGLGIVNSLLIQ